MSFWAIIKFFLCVFAAFFAVLGATTRMDISSAVDRFMFVNGQGHLIGFPTRPGSTSTATTGVPTNAVAGFAKSALFFNWLGSIGSLLYINSGSNTSATWTNIA